MILISGSLAFDQILDFPGNFSDHIMPDKIHKLNVSFLVDNMRKGFGGTAGNIAYTLSLLGVKTFILGYAGEDFKLYRNFLETNEVNTSYIKEMKGFYTSTAIGLTDLHDNQIWGFHGGADVFSEDLSINSIIEPIDFGVIAPNNPKAMKKFASEYRKKNTPYLFDPGMQLPYLDGDDLKEAFQGARIIIGNDYEISVMEKKTGIKDLHSLSEKGKIIITTLSHEGSIVSQNGERIKIRPAKPSEVLDPAGAGDCFRAGFLTGYFHNFSMKTCGQMGSVASVYSVEKYGTTSHSFSKTDFERRYQENFGEKIEI